jgi:flagellar hook-associated protein 3 FlgL
MTSVSTSAFYERSRLDLAGLRARAESLQSALGSGERLSRSSDDPVAAARLRVLMRAESFSSIDLANASLASADLQLADGALSDFAAFTIRAKELATQAASGTLNAAQRAALGQELGLIHSNLFALANARNAAGFALFGGETAGQAYVLDASGNAVYAGTASAGDLALGEGLSVGRGLTGPEFLGFSHNGAPTNLLAVVKGLAEALQGSAADPAAAARDALSALDAGLDQVSAGQTLVGARLAWIDLSTERRTDLSELRSSEQAELGGTDLAATVTRLQQAMTVLEASQASFARLASLSLFDVIN